MSESRDTKTEHRCFGEDILRNFNNGSYSSRLKAIVNRTDIGNHQFFLEASSRYYRIRSHSCGRMYIFSQCSKSTFNICCCILYFAMAMGFYHSWKTSWICSTFVWANERRKRMSIIYHSLYDKGYKYRLYHRFLEIRAHYLWSMSTWLRILTCLDTVFVSQVYQSCTGHAQASLLISVTLKIIWWESKLDSTVPVTLVRFRSRPRPDDL